jgi:SRSO17 transposase
LHFVANATWSDELTLAKVRELVMPSITRGGPIEAWIIDDRFPRRAGIRWGCIVSIAVLRAARQANYCQVAVTLSSPR